VTRYLSKIKDKTKKEVKEVFTPSDKKKLDLIQQYTPEQLKEILYRLQLDNKKSIEQTI